MKRLLKCVGKSFEPAPDLPPMLILGTLTQRAIWFARGILRLRKKIFVAPGVRLRGAGHIQFGDFCTLEHGCSIDGYAQGDVIIGPRTRIGAGTVISLSSHLSKVGKHLVIGSDSGIGEFGYLGAAGGLKIGRNVIMGQYVSFHTEEHVIDDPDQIIRNQGTRSKGIVIEDDVWIGAKATILDGARIGRHSVIAAGAVVKGEFPSYAVLGGVPARILRRLPCASTEKAIYGEGTNHQ